MVFTNSNFLSKSSRFLHMLYCENSLNFSEIKIIFFSEIKVVKVKSFEECWPAVFWILHPKFWFLHPVKYCKQMKIYLSLKMLAFIGSLMGQLFFFQPSWLNPSLLLIHTWTQAAEYALQEFSLYPTSIPSYHVCFFYKKQNSQQPKEGNLNFYEWMKLNVVSELL